MFRKLRNMLINANEMSAVEEGGEVGEGRKIVKEKKNKQKNRLTRPGGRGREKMYM